MLTPILATDDPYEAAAVFVKAGWSLVFQTPRDSGDPLACVALAGAQLMLGTPWVNGRSTRSCLATGS